MKSLLLVVAILAGCGGDPLDVEGTWTVAVTNRDNACQINGWNVGDTSSGIQVIVTQNGENANADVAGGGGLYLDLLLGGNALFTGLVDDEGFDLTRQGTRSMNQGNCTYTYNAEILATVTGDTMTGRINYRSATNGNSDCAAIECLNFQDFNGTRPPR